MEFTRTKISDVLLIRPRVFTDARGFFFESWQRTEFASNGIDVDFVQDNHSNSKQWTLRGLHYQLRRPQGKLVRVLAGSVFDVAVDLRRSSATFGSWVGEVLSSENQLMMWIPPGFAHGFLALSETADFAYKCTNYYDPSSERSLLWNDPDLGIEWPIAKGLEPLLSNKDAHAPALSTASVYP